MPPKGRKPASRKTCVRLNITSLNDIERERSRIKKARMDTRKELRSDLAGKLEEIKQRLAANIAENIRAVQDARDAAVQQLDQALEQDDQKKIELVQLADKIELKTRSIFLQTKNVIDDKAKHASKENRMQPRHA